MPLQVATEHPLFVNASKRGKPPWDMNDASNGSQLPTSTKARAPGTENLPAHDGSHPNYSDEVAKLATTKQNELLGEYGSWANVPPDKLTKAATAVQNAMRRRLGKWRETHGETVNDQRQR